MVTYVLDVQDDNKVVFLYYPENDRRNHAGEILYNKKNKRLDINRYADMEWLEELTTEEAEEKRAKGIVDFVDTTKRGRLYAFYGSPVLSEIHKQIDLGVFPLEGKVV